MENPGALLRRARQNRRFKGRQDPPPKEEAAPAVQVCDPPPSPPHRSSHASYTALMRSHDRVHTRHIGGQS